VPRFLVVDGDLFLSWSSMFHSLSWLHGIVDASSPDLKRPLGSFEWPTSVSASMMAYVSSVTKWKCQGMPKPVLSYGLLQSPN
jgi:hypothetical protein